MQRSENGNSISVKLIALIAISAYLCLSDLNSVANPGRNAEIDTVDIVIHVFNLSENMGRLSTNNDEMILLVYPYDYEMELRAPLIAKQFVLDPTNNRAEIAWKLPEYSSKNKYAFVLIVEKTANVTTQFRCKVTT
ncbi:MAG: hypothetical protein HRT71_07970 [Flavobacteriales bacterium]|nr:hypothetical protein [Flavobacteriales bacterium]